MVRVKVGSNDVQQAFNLLIIIIAADLTMEVIIVATQILIVPLLDQIVKGLGKLFFIKLGLTEEIEDEDAIVAPEQVIDVPSKRPTVLSRALNRHLRRFFGLLRPEKRDRPTDLHVREGARAMVEEHDHLRLNEVAHVSLLVDAAGVEPCADSSS